MSIENLKTYDPFAEADEDNGGDSKDSTSTKIHIRIQQRNGRKTLTTVQGIPKTYSLKKILSEVKKTFACNGTIVVDPDHGDVIQLQGDQRNNMYEFMINQDHKKGLQIDKNLIQIHGF